MAGPIVDLHPAVHSVPRSEQTEGYRNFHPECSRPLPAEVQLLFQDSQTEPAAAVFAAAHKLAAADHSAVAAAGHRPAAAGHKLVAAGHRLVAAARKPVPVARKPAANIEAAERLAVGKLVEDKQAVGKLAASSSNRTGCIHANSLNRTISLLNFRGIQLLLE